MALGRIQTSIQTIFGVGLLLCAAALIAVGLYHLLTPSTCSPHGQLTSHGVVRFCPSRTGAWIAFVAGGGVLLVTGGAVLALAARLFVRRRSAPSGAVGNEAAAAFGSVHEPDAILAGYAAAGSETVASVHGASVTAAATDPAPGARRLSLTSLLAALALWGCAVVGPVELSHAVAGKVHVIHRRHRAALDAVVSGYTGPPFGAGAVGPTDALSLFRPPNFRWALATAKTQLGSDTQLDNVALYPGYVDVTAVKSGKVVQFHLDAEGHWQLQHTGGTVGDALFPWSKVTYSAPAVLAQRIDADAGLAESGLNYMVAEVDPAAGQFRWLVYTLPGNPVAYFEAASANGSLYEDLTSNSGGLQPIG